MLLKELLKDVQYTVIKGNIEKEVKDICYNSKEASSDKAFVAISGFIVDGHDYINDALDKGCKVIILENDKIDIPDDVTIIKLDNTRIGLSKISRTLFGYPDKELTTVAITGTKGKTTTSWIVKEILNLASLECGYIGTIGVFYKDKGYDTVNTTPEAYDVFKYMREMINNGVKYLAMEVTSQALKLERFPEVMFDYGVFTTIGENTFANFNFTVLDTCPVTIGDNVFFGPNCTLATPLHPLRYHERNIKFKSDGTPYDDEYGKPLVIESKCWIASNVVIAGGVTIGEGSVIGAGSVVTRDIPPHSLAAGNPCRVIRQITEADSMRGSNNR